MLGAAGHQLRHQVQAGGVDVPGGVAVVTADVILLGRSAVQQAAGLHEELLHADVVWKAVFAQVGEKIQLGIIAKHPFNKRFEKAFLQAVAQGWTAQAQRGVDRQRPLRQLGNAPVQRIDEQVGFAQTQRHAQMNMRRQTREYVVNCLLD